MRYIRIRNEDRDLYRRAGTRFGVISRPLQYIE